MSLSRYMNASMITSKTYDNLLYNLADEFDLPMYGGYTGFENSTHAVPVDSIYRRMRARNRCVHRDFQNVCVNGMRSHPMLQLLDTVARNQTTDHPMLVFFELIGNCLLYTSPSPRD